MINEPQELSILLSGYTFSSGRHEIGSISLSANEIGLKKVSLSGEDAKAFSVKGNKLCLLPSHNKKDAEYDLTISVDTDFGVFSESFKIISDSFIKNKVIAHRGAWRNRGLPENSIAALQHAVKLGCGASEFDVHMSSDLKIFVNHDYKVQGIPLEKAASTELQKLKLANNETLPTLNQYLEKGLNQKSTRLVLEIKPSAINKETGIKTAQKVVEIIKDYKAQAWLDYISFDYEICTELVKLQPQASVAYLKGDKSPEDLGRDKIPGFDYAFSVLRKNPDWIKKAHEKNLTTNVWTVDREDDMRWLLKQNIDFITTNEPELLLEILKTSR